MTKRISITGIDGTGKTTLVRLLREKSFSNPSEIQAFRAPQYHEDPNSPFSKLSLAIDNLSVLGDQLKDPLVKSAALFLSVTLFGDVENFYENTYRPKYLYSERQAVVDTLSYSAFYKQLLKAPIDPVKLESTIRNHIGDEDFQSILRWVEVLQSRGLTSSREVSFWNLPLNIFDLLSQDQKKIVEDLKRVYHSRIPDQLIILKVSSDELQKRLQEKAKSGVAPEELHEKKPVLEMLQGALLKGAEAMKALHPEMDLQILDTSEQSIEQSLKNILSLR